MTTRSRKQVEMSKELLDWFETKGTPFNDAIPVLAITITAILKTMTKQDDPARFEEGVQLVTKLIRNEVTH